MGAVTAARLVGRAAVLEQLRQSVAAAVEGVPTLVLLEGEAGIGKSRLVAELSAEPIAAAVRIAVGHCSVAAGRHLPFGPWIDILRGLVRHVGGDQVVAWAGQDQAVLSHLLPALRGGVPATTRPSPGQVYEAVAGLLTAAAVAQPLVVVVEDLHWSDASSRELLEHLVRVIRDDRLLVIGTTRTDEPDTDEVAALLAELTRLPYVTRIALNRFTRDEVTEQLTALLGTTPTSALVDQVVGLSEGVPFLVEEAVAADASGTTAGVFATGLVGHRLTRLSAPARQLVNAAAVGQDPLLTDLLRLASGLDVHEFDLALREAMDDRVLDVDPREASSYRFRHVLLRTAARERLMPGERAELNKRWATVLDGSTRLDPLIRASALARHWMAADDAGRALAACLVAAEEASNVGAYPEQGRWLDQAITLWSQVPDAQSRTGLNRTGLLSAAAEAMFVSGNITRAEQLISLGLAEPATPDTRQQRAWLKVFRLWTERQHDRYVPVTQAVAAVEALPHEPASYERARALEWLAGRLGQGGRPQDGLPYADEAVQICSTLGDSGRVADALTTRALLLSGLGQDDEAVAILETARERARSAEVRWRCGIELALGAVLWTAGRDHDSAAAHRRGRDLAGGDRPGALPTPWAMQSLNLAEALMDLGGWAEAGQLIDRVLASPGMSEWIMGWADRLGGHLAVWRGELDATLCHYNGPRGDDYSDIDIGEIQNILPNRFTRADIAAIAGRPGEVRDTLRPVLSEPRCTTFSGVLWPILEVAARLEGEVARGRHPETAVDADVLDQVNTLLDLMPPRNPRDAAFAATIAAQLARARGENDVDLWSAALKGWREVGFPHQLGWTAVHLAETAATQNRVLAGEALHEAAQVAHDLGARPLLNEVNRLAHPLRLRLPKQRAPGDSTVPVNASIACLTERELEVLGLVADGCSNQDIAARLFISPKTASVHVSHILTKLTVRNRTEAAAVARRSGAVDLGN